MISRQFIADLATKLQTTEPNIAREYCQHLFLSYFYKRTEAEKILFKGGTALRIIFDSPRFSEDLDFSASNSQAVTVSEINQLIDDTLSDIETEGIEAKKEVNAGTKGETSGGYFAIVRLKMLEFDSELKIQISFRSPDKVISNNGLVVGEFIAPYSIVYLTERILISEKIEALLARKKPRDFFDLYFILKDPNLKDFIPKRKNLKTDLIRTISEAGDFERELKIFLPVSHHSLLKDFKDRLDREIEMHIAN
ncbi:MAG: nucleotidyl transferase AbiEii/AbiGii toxin family protein [Parcubacteria group bacterium]|nr:nucleotidyl transferase AbiEii/AbiGii toxin family protein [Parcubacteria group bacterium]